MKILIVGLVKNPQILRLTEEAKKRGHELVGCYSSDLVVEAQTGKFHAHLNGKSLTDYDLIYLWAISSKRWEWYTVAHWLHKKHSTKIINQRVVNGKYNFYLAADPVIDYYQQVQHSLPIPRSTIVFKPKTISSYINKFKFPVILKTSLGSQGKGVFKIHSVKELRTKINTLKTSSPAMIVREFIPNSGDIRIFTLGGTIIGAMQRTPPKGDFRSNISQGGQGSEYDLSGRPDLALLAQKASAAVQLDIAGVDIIIDKNTNKPYILEVNPGPQFTGLEKYTSTNVALEIIKYFEKITSKE